VYALLEKYGFKTQKLLPEGIEYKHTKTWSLLYKREHQVVGREVMKLKMK
jgi:hypothetical protein